MKSLWYVLLVSALVLTTRLGASAAEAKPAPPRLDRNQLLVYHDRQGVAQPATSVRDPAALFVTLDEREDSIDDAFFAVNVLMVGGSANFQNLPASYHNGACGFSFADGHAELHRWRDGRTKPPIQRGSRLPCGIASPHNPDVAWLQEHATQK